MDKIIGFFLTKARLNYFLFTILIIAGMSSYNNKPRDIFPALEIDKIIVTGSYAGASIKTLNNMVVTELEKELKSLSGVKRLDTFVKNGSFTIMLTLLDGSDKTSILSKSKDTIALFKGNLPSDMDEPTAVVLDFSWPLINVTLSSETVSKYDLITTAQEIKSKLAAFSGIAKIQLYDNTTKTFEIVIDSEKLDVLNINKALLFQAIKELSYIYPIGKIDDQNEHLYLTTNNGKKKAEELLETELSLGDKSVYLSDVATVIHRYKKTDVISKLNGNIDIQLGLFKSSTADAIDLVKVVKDELKAIDKSYPDIRVATFADSSVYIKNRLNTVISGLMFGLILVAATMYILINKRVAFIVVLGIPTAVLIGLVIMSFTSYTINMMTLIGVLLILGILVDDAVIIAENIQRHIQMGEDKFTATLSGTKEVFIPVMASSITTIFAFFPMLMLSGEMGAFLLMIPISIMILILASIIESFVFLPLHALHTLDADQKELDWTKAQNFYKRWLSKLVEHRRRSLTLFVIGTFIITMGVGSIMRYQLFPDFDSDRLFIQGKFDNNVDVQQVYEKTKIMEEILLKNKKDLAIESISYTPGMRTDNQGQMEVKPSVFQFNVELESRVPSNFVDGFITPMLTGGSDRPKTRVRSVDETLAKFQELLKDVKDPRMLEFVVKKEGAGVTQNDIEIMINAKDQVVLLDAIKQLKEKLNSIDGMTFVDDTAKFGVRELKISVNAYGESLGLSESSVARALAPLYLDSEQAKGLDSDGVFQIISYAQNKNSFNKLSTLKIAIPNSDKSVALSDVTNFEYLDNFDRLYKRNGVDMKTVVANVNNKIVTPTEVLKKIKPLLEELQSKGIYINLAGEKEQNDQMASEMGTAMSIAMALIFTTLLIMFNSFRKTFIVLSIIPLSIIGALIGHIIVGMPMTLTSFIGILGLAGVVINNAIVMLDFIRHSKTIEDVINRAKLRLRPILITSITTFVGLSTLIFFATGQAKILQPIAISLGFGLLWGTVLTLLYLPLLYMVVFRIRGEHEEISSKPSLIAKSILFLQNKLNTSKKEIS
jgi:hydrophobic/amphiphilic exporter-1 (mainly G- bacteria), HAE1 family